MNDHERLAIWRSWLNKDLIPEGWGRSLWDEFFGLLHRRAMWRGYREVLAASPDDAQNSGRWLTQWIMRNHVETQSIAVRRMVHRTPDERVVSLGRLLDDIADNPHLIDGDPAETSLDARFDADRLSGEASKVVTFANKYVAHLDRDHKAAKGTLFVDLDSIVDEIAAVWERWYPRVTGIGVVVIEPLPEGWSGVVRLRRRNAAFDKPAMMGGLIAYRIGPSRAAEYADLLEGDAAERCAWIGRLWGNESMREHAEDLFEIESTADYDRSALVDALRTAARLIS